MSHLLSRLGSLLPSTKYPAPPSTLYFKNLAHAFLYPALYSWPQLKPSLQKSRIIAPQSVPGQQTGNLVASFHSILSSLTLNSSPSPDGPFFARSTFLPIFCHHHYDHVTLHQDYCTSLGQSPLLQFILHRASRRAIKLCFHP